MRRTYTFAPKLRQYFIFRDLELTAKIQLYPFMMLTIAKLKPVLPDVVSIIVSPGIKFLSFQLLL
jgi:hypothetical protein